MTPVHEETTGRPSSLQDTNTVLEERGNSSALTLLAIFSPELQDTLLTTTNLNGKLLNDCQCKSDAKKPPPYGYRYLGSHRHPRFILSTIFPVLI